MDSENEMLIQKSLQKAMAGKTTLVIAHRLSTLKNMDRIVVIKNGKIIETGSIINCCIKVVNIASYGTSKHIKNKRIIDDTYGKVL